MASEEHEEIVKLLKDSIAASNRTTHAVRAIVLPSTILLITGLVVIPLVLAGFFSDESLLILAGLALITGIVAAIIAEIRETKLSAIPGLDLFGHSGELQTGNQPGVGAQAYSEPELIDQNEPCSCKRWEQRLSGFGTRTINGVECCGICGRPVA
jgi:hypothetical protein